MRSLSSSFFQLQVRRVDDLLVLRLGGVKLGDVVHEALRLLRDGRARRPEGGRDHPRHVGQRRGGGGEVGHHAQEHRDRRRYRKHRDAEFVHRTLHRPSSFIKNRLERPSRRSVKEQTLRPGQLGEELREPAVGMVYPQIQVIAAQHHQSTAGGQEERQVPGGPLQERRRVRFFCARRSVHQVRILVLCPFACQRRKTRSPVLTRFPHTSRLYGLKNQNTNICYYLSVLSFSLHLDSARVPVLATSTILMV